MSVPMPTSVPMSRLSLSVMSNLAFVVRHPVLQARVADGDLPAVAGQGEVEEADAAQGSAGRAHEPVVLVLGP